jgi:hypothetical protein
MNNSPPYNLCYVVVYEGYIRNIVNFLRLPMGVSKISNYESYNSNGLVLSHLGSKLKVLTGKFIAMYIYIYI